MQKKGEGLVEKFRLCNHNYFKLCMLIIISTSFYWSLSPIHSCLFIDLCILSWADIWCKLTPLQKWRLQMSFCCEELPWILLLSFSIKQSLGINMQMKFRHTSTWFWQLDFQGTTLSHCPSLRNVPRSHSYLWAWGIHNYRPMTCKKKAWDNILGLMPIGLTNDYS